MPKNHNTPRDELVCGKLDNLAIRMQVEGDHRALELIQDIRHDCERMEQKLISRKQEARVSCGSVKRRSLSNLLAGLLLGQLPEIEEDYPTKVSMRVLDMIAKNNGSRLRIVRDLIYHIRELEKKVHPDNEIHLLPPSWGGKASICGRVGFLAKNFQDTTCEHCLAKSKEKPVPLGGPLRVIRAAVTDSKTGEVYSLVAPARHPHIMWYMNDMGLREHHGEQGFILSDGTFADRMRAKNIALSAGQLIKGARIQGDLYSEDVW